MQLCKGPYFSDCHRSLGAFTSVHIFRGRRPRFTENACGCVVGKLQYALKHHFIAPALVHIFE